MHKNVNLVEKLQKLPSAWGFAPKPPCSWRLGVNLRSQIPNSQRRLEDLLPNPLLLEKSWLRHWAGKIQQWSNDNKCSAFALVQIFHFTNLIYLFNGPHIFIFREQGTSL